ncbi:hypothetical protein [Criblamydia sequanensis]|uniref:Secreted protein n=1 Tax=Candidatus Criblamydia sequanensis CRIB-18 TaxID=1437425 RepID=A0A090CZJ3_9BACT|nr:hypothetical protein [Criblamydia sequanensis]CDR32845.1 putative secreted protein [Criblamydia sequanensis CRIB-18]
MNVDNNVMGKIWMLSLNASMRLPAYAMNATALALTAEAVLRFLEALPIRPALEYNTSPGSLAGRVKDWARPITESYVMKNVSLRPFGEKNDTGEYKIPNATIVISAGVGLALSAALCEILRVSIGEPSQLMNRVLEFVSPFRIGEGALKTTELLFKK